MKKKIFYVSELDYRQRVKSAIAKAGGVLLNDSEVQRRDIANHHGIEVYNFGELRTTLLYGGKRMFIIAGTKEAHIKKTKSKLEEISGVRLIVPGDKQYA